MTPTIEAGQNSLKLSYLRFISDSAPGLLLVLGLLVLDRNRPLPIAVVPRDDAFRALAAVIAFLLVTPLGLMINGISHFLLGGVQHAICGRCLSSATWPIVNTHDILLVKQWRAYFGVNRDNWPQIAYEIDDLFDTYMPHLAAVLDHVRALKKFLRSFALLTASSIFVLAGAIGAWAAVTLLLAIVIALFLKTKKVQWVIRALMIIAVGIAIYGCWANHLIAALGLLAVFMAAATFAGLVEFYQYGSVMLFLYQLFFTSTECRFELSAESVRERLKGLVARVSPTSPNSPRLPTQDP